MIGASPDLGSRMGGNEADDPFDLYGRIVTSVSTRPSPRTSTRSAPSGLTMISMMRGSPSAAAMAGPMAVRSMARRRSAEMV
jgi:hypothetical protein